MKKQLLLVLFICFNLITLQAGEVTLASPYETIYNHLYYLQKDSYQPELAAESILPNSEDQNTRIEMAIHIKQILDGKGLYIDMNQIPKVKNYIDSSNNQAIYYVSELEPRIYLEQKNGNWYYSEETIQKINEMYDEVYPLGTKVFSRLLPAKIRNMSILGLFAWQWLGILLIFIIGFFIYRLIQKIVQLLLHYIIYKKEFVSKEKELSLGKIAKAFSLATVIYTTYKIVPSLQFSPQALQYIVKPLSILLIFLVAIFINRIFEHIADFFTSFVERSATKLDDQLLPIIKKLFKLMLFTIAFSLALKQLNVNLTAIIAGLSIGGLALALASQDTVKNFIGSATIFLDHPFEIGDYIQIPGTEGTVEEVGMRATRLRTPNQSVAYVPNGELSNMIIDNMGLRVYRRWRWFIGVEYETNPTQIDAFCTQAKSIINSNENVVESHTIVRLNELGASSVNLIVNVFLDVKNFEAELNAKHDLLLELMALAKELNVEFAFPTQTLHIKNEDS